MTEVLPPLSSLIAGPNQDPRENPSMNRTSAKFHPLLVTEALVRTLKFCFGQMPNPNYRWEPDPVLSRLHIGRVNETLPSEEDATQRKPRILVNRGTYTISESGLNQSLTEGVSPHIAKGDERTKHMNIIQGNFSIIIEAQQEGTAEMLVDMVSSFLTWSSVHICNTHGFNKFGFPMYVGEVALDKEDTEKFKVVINSGYLMETHYKIWKDGYKLMNFNLDSEVTS